MQNVALARTGRLGLDRDALVAIYVGLRFYRLKQSTDVSDADAFAQLGRLLDSLRALPNTPADLETAIAQELANAVEHNRPGSGEAALLKIMAQLAAG